MQDADRQRSTDGDVRTTVYRKRMMAIRQLTSCLMASYVLLSKSAAAASVRDIAAKPGSQPPQVRAQYPASLIAQLGSTVRIICPVHGDPRPLISWTKDSRTVHVGWQRFRIHGPGTWLYITDVRTTDAGKYTCKATNGFGTAVVTIHLLVVTDTNNASLHDAADVISGQPVTSSEVDESTYGSGAAVTLLLHARDNATTTVAAADVDDMLMVLSLCIGTAICVISLAVIVVLTLRRRLQDARDEHVIVPVSATQRLLQIATARSNAAAGSRVASVDVTTTIRRKDGNLESSPQTLYSDNGIASHVTAMKLLITSNRHDFWASSADTCFV